MYLIENRSRFTGQFKWRAWKGKPNDNVERIVKKNIENILDSYVFTVDENR